MTLPSLTALSALSPASTMAPVATEIPSSVATEGFAAENFGSPLPLQTPQPLSLPISPLFAERAVTPAMQKLEAQRRYCERAGHFRFDRLTAEVVSLMTAEEQIAVATQLVKTAQRTMNQAWLATQSPKTETAADWQRIAGRYAKQATRWEDLHYRVALKKESATIYGDLFSSVTQQTMMMNMHLADFSARLGRGQITPENARGEFKKYDPRPLVDGGRKAGDTAVQFKVRHTCKEMAQSLIEWLILNFPQVSPTEKGYRFEGVRREKQKELLYFKLEFWPPDPSHDPRLSTHLQLLGWKMRVGEDGGRLFVEIDFS